MIASILKALAAAGASPEMLVAAVEAHEADAAACYAEEAKRVEALKESRRLVSRERQRRHRLSRVTERDTALVTVTPPKREVPEPLRETTPQKETPSLRDGAKKPDLVLIALGEVLDEQHATAVLEHRTLLRKRLTPHAARLLVGKLARCDDPNAAADAMIANGWQGFEPEWLERQNGNRGPPKARSQNGYAAFALSLAESHYGPTDQYDGSPPAHDAGAGPATRRVAAPDRILDAERSDKAGQPRSGTVDR